MSQALKELFSPAMIQALADEIETHAPQFDKNAFKAAIFNQAWSNLSLKQRLTHVACCLKTHLPADYALALTVLIQVAPKFQGLTYACFPEFVALFGLQEDFELNMLALAHFTEFSTAEFAVRPFIEQDPARLLAQAMIWAKSENEHHRRLASEGFRPRLPWASHLGLFRENPRLVLPILEMLKTDESLYVRKSVANCLNDISKDHPDLIKALTQKWQTLPKRKKETQLNPHTAWILRHANRTLLKKSDAHTLKQMGFEARDDLSIRSFKADKQVVFGEQLHFAFNVFAKESLGKLRLEFEIDFMKANGKLASKRFQISQTEETGRKKSIDKYFAFVPRTTRQYYAGKHVLKILANGQVIKQHNFKLLMP
ncbi:MAG: DNA alkylation repair protein [Thiotrichales bacterium]|nr:DNA alkylation repair protein [Thiotrichales bacterium]